MFTPVLTTKLYIPRVSHKTVLRPHLVGRLNDGLTRRLILISAPAGCGKTTLVSEWIASSEHSAAWLSLDEGDNDLARFLTYFIAALQTIANHVGQGLLSVLQSPQLPPIDSLLTILLNDIATIQDNFLFVLDDYHVIEAGQVNDAITFLLTHLPSQMHLVMVTREDPHLPLARLRARGQLTELRIADLRFTPSETSEFLNEIMGLHLSGDNIAALEEHTEGWIAGLHLAAISMQGHSDVNGFVRSFAGSHHFVMDFLVEEVLQQQPDYVQTFLLRTSILNRMSGSLCNAILLDTSGQETLEHLQRANLFILALDDDRRWFRYHHLFAQLLKQRLQQSIGSENTEDFINELHIRASQWYEDNGLDLEAFHHAAAGKDIERVERLCDGKGIPLHLRGAVTAIVNWLASLPTSVLDARPSLWWRYAAMLLVIGQTTGVEEKLDAAESILQRTGIVDRHLIGRIATARAVLALTRYDVETMLIQSHRALEYLPAPNLSTRANVHWTLGLAHCYRGDRSAGRKALTEAISLSGKSGDTFITILATLALGNLEEMENNLYLAAEIYQQNLVMAGDQPLQIVSESHLGMARVLYEWNDLDGAEQHAQKSLRLARQFDSVIDRFILSEVFLARVKLARRQVTDAAALLSRAERLARQRGFVHRIPEIAAAQVQVLLHQGDLAGANTLAHAHNLPLSRVRVLLARHDVVAALALLELLRQQTESNGLQDEQLKVMILQTVALYVNGERDRALQLLRDLIVLAEPGGFIRLFVDEGLPMVNLLSEASNADIKPDYVHRLLEAFEAENQRRTEISQPLIEPLSRREIDVLYLIAQGFSNQEIGERLFLALDTVKGHNRRIFNKLQVQRRTEAVARARELGLI
jgi:LuxR family transcriptional regulator, maltose regulon positive regulatory protein